MSSTLYAEDVTCSVCLCVFTEPVTLRCGHAFCRGCVTEPLCPQCRAALPTATELQLLRTSLILQGLAQRVRERPQQRPGAGAAEEMWLCPEHEEQMKLFCVTDQRLACTICRDSEAHDGHKFKPIREAAAALRRDVDLGLVSIASQTKEIQKLTQAQSGEMRKAKELSSQLRSQVQQQFEAMHQFLRKREDQILNELRVQEEDAVENMSESLNAMNQALSECGEQRDSWTRIMKVTDPETFLRRWSEEHGSAATGDLFKARSEGLAVVPSPLFQGPYQSHLQFFIWKEMLQEVEPKADLLTLRDDNPHLTVSGDRRSFHYAPENWQKFHPARYNSFGQATSVGQSKVFGYSSVTFGQAQGFASNVPQSFAVSSTNAFSSGQHYWEVEVGQRDFWCVGIHSYFMKYENQKYFMCETIRNTEVSVSGPLLKLGVYLNCSSKTLTFYNADSMLGLHKCFCDGLSLPVSAYFSIRQKEPDTNPITVCRY